MKYLKFMLGVLVVLLPMLAYVFWPGDDAQIKKLVNEAVASVEAGDISGVMAQVSLNYHDERGMSYLYLKKILERNLNNLENIKVEFVSLKIRVIGEDKAFATMEIRVIASFPGGGSGYFLGDIDNPFFMELELRDESPRGWKVYSAKYGHQSA